MDDDMGEARAKALASLDELMRAADDAFRASGQPDPKIIEGIDEVMRDIFDATHVLRKRISTLPDELAANKNDGNRDHRASANRVPAPTSAQIQGDGARDGIRARHHRDVPEIGFYAVN